MNQKNSFSYNKQYQKDKTEAENKKYNIIKRCRELGQTRFVDDSFPPCDKSLLINYQENKKPKFLQNVEWIFSKDITTEPNESDLKWTVYNEPTYSDIIQGSLGNCWLISALTLIVERPNILRQIILTDEYCKYGCYQLRLFKDGEWQNVMVDDCFPCDMDRKLIYSKASRKQLWVPLIEKAFAKLNGNYESLERGFINEGLSALTGYPCEAISIDEDHSKLDYFERTSLWKKILTMKDFGFLMGASCGKNDKDKQFFTDVGLQSCHAYSLLDVAEVQQHKLIQLRNPWGTNNWKGDWSEKSNLWTDEIKDILKPYNDKGTFWISFDDFVKYFYMIEVCKFRDDWFYKTVKGYFNSENDKKIKLFELIVYETCEINIGLFLKTKCGRLDENLDLSFGVFKLGKDPERKLEVYSRRSVRKHVSREHTFEPGQYYIVPCSFIFWNTEKPIEQKSYNLVIHSTKEFYIEKHLRSSFFLQDLIIKMAKENGRKCDPNCRYFYEMSYGYSGIVVIAENLDEKNYLHVKLDFKGSQDIVSTRNTFLTYDSIPPKSCQILNLLTETSAKRIIQYEYAYKMNSNESLDKTWTDQEENTKNSPPLKQPFDFHSPIRVE